MLGSMWPVTNFLLNISNVWTKLLFPEGNSGLNASGSVMKWILKSILEKI